MLYLSWPSELCCIYYDQVSYVVFTMTYLCKCCICDDLVSYMLYLLWPSELCSIYYALVSYAVFTMT